MRDMEAGSDVTETAGEALTAKQALTGLAS